MKKMRKTIAFFMAMAMLAGVAALAMEDSGTITVALRIEGVEEMLYYDYILIGEGSTVEDLMRVVGGIEDELGIVIESYSTGDTYISEIAGLAEYEYGGFSGWSFRVNDVSPTVGQSLVFLEDGDRVVFFYGDPWGEPGMQYPYADLSRLYSEGLVGIFSDDEEYDDDWNMTQATNPVAGATVTFAGTVYTTDEKGEFAIADKAGLAGLKSLQIERYDKEAGVPTVLRLEPNTVIYVPFADTPPDEWYSYAVWMCVVGGMFIGTDTERNLFSPETDMTMAQLATVLGRIAGNDFNASPTTPWYASARDWAIENGVISEGKFEAVAPLTREEFIHMFYLTSEIVGVYDMTVRADISDAVDYDDISEEYLEAISWAVASKIIRGTDSSALTISPDFVVNRATVCQMIVNYER